MIGLMACFLFYRHVNKQLQTLLPWTRDGPTTMPTIPELWARTILPLWKQWETTNTASVCHLLPSTSALPSLPTSLPITNMTFRPFLYVVMHYSGGDGGKGETDDSLQRTSAAARIPIPVLKKNTCTQRQREDFLRFDKVIQCHTTEEVARVTE